MIFGTYHVKVVFDFYRALQIIFSSFLSPNFGDGCRCMIGSLLVK